VGLSAQRCVQLASLLCSRRATDGLLCAVAVAWCVRVVWCDVDSLQVLSRPRFLTLEAAQPSAVSSRVVNSARKFKATRARR
jgi:hypothetical protein